MSGRPVPLTRAAFPVIRPVPTRWSDNDAYGHLNNVVYYALFDAALNAELIAAGALDVTGDAVIGVVAESGCAYFRSLAFPETVEVGIGVSRMGATSTRFVFAAFRQGEDAAAAQGHFVQVSVDRATGRPAPHPPALRAVLERLAMRA